MVQESYTRSFLSRLVNAFFGVLIGLALIVGAFVLVFWNEGQSLHTAQALKQTQAKLVRVSPQPVNPQNNHRAVYVMGLATTQEMLSDPVLHYSAKALKLVRHAQMYQWRQNVETKTENELGGSEKQVKTYSYEKLWSDSWLDSSA